MPIDFQIIRPFIIAALTFTIAMIFAPAFLRFLRRNRLGKNLRDLKKAPIAMSLHAAKAGTPTMGGIIIWATVAAVILVLSYGCQWFNAAIFCDLNFLSRGETLLPLGVLVAAALVGLLDDYLNIKKIGPHGGGLRVRHRLVSYTAIALLAAWWFYSKLEWDIIHIPFDGNIPLGLWYIPLFAFVLVATSNAVNLTDGLDGLAGGTLMAAFGSFGVIAFAQGKYDLAVFCAAILGALLAFLWHNITPAAFFMGDTGAMALGTVLGVIAMLTNQPLLLPLIGLPFVLETSSVIIQVASKKIRGKKVFKSAPLHHHFEAIGWGEPKVVMRFWVIAVVCAAIGTVIALVD